MAIAFQKNLPAKFQHYIAAIKDSIAHYPTDRDLRRHYAYVRLFNKLRPYLLVLAGAELLLFLFFPALTDMAVWARFVGIGTAVFIIAFCILMPSQNAAYDREYGEAYRQMLDRQKEP